MNTKTKNSIFLLLLITVFIETRWLTHKVPTGVGWYELIDSGDNPMEGEHRFGPLRTFLKEKSAECRLCSQVLFIKQSSLIQYINNGDVQALLFNGAKERTVLAVRAEAGYTNAVSTIVITITVNSGTAKAFSQACGDGIINEFKGADTNAIQIQAGTYPALAWIDGDTNLAGIVQL